MARKKPRIRIIAVSQVYSCDIVVNQSKAVIVLRRIKKAFLYYRERHSTKDRLWKVRRNTRILYPDYHLSVTIEKVKTNDDTKQGKAVQKDDC